MRGVLLRFSVTKNEESNMKNLLCAVALFVLGGCSLIGPSGFSILDEAREKGVEIEDKVLDAAAMTADKYCITPQVIRFWLRDQINSRTTQAEVIVICPGDVN